MKIILSRKGYDSAAGGMPSPIFPDGSFCSLPIPSEQKPRLKEIRFHGDSLGKIVDRLRPGERIGDSGVHLDPDRDKSGLQRRPGWRPCFGQAGAAQTHLQNQNVGEGDLFLFFGWFREVASENGKLQFRVGAPDIHALFGWLQVGSVHHPGAVGDEVPAWALEHPHVKDADYYDSVTTNNTVYLSSKRLCLPGLEVDLPGGGTFERFRPHLQLTETGSNRSIWRLPACFYPTKGKPSLSYHADIKRWRKDNNGVTLHTVGRGQEFVLDTVHYPAVAKWVSGMFAQERRRKLAAR